MSKVMKRNQFIRNLLFFIFYTILIFPTQLSSEISDVNRIYELDNISVPGTSTYGIAYDGDNLWAVDSDSYELYRIDSENQANYQCTLQISKWPSGLCWDNGKLYVNGKGSIYEVDTSSGECELLFTITTSTQWGVLGLATDGDYFYSVDRYEKMIHKYSRPDYKLTDTFPLDFDHTYIRCLTYHDGYLWLMDSSKDRVHRINPDSGTMMGYFSAPSIPYPRGVEYADGVWWISDNENCQLIPTVMQEISNGMRSNPRLVTITFNLYISNNYPISLKDIEVWAAIPMDTPRQEILNFTEITQPISYEYDDYGQMIGYYKFENVPRDSFVLTQWEAEARLWDIKYFPMDIGGYEDIPTDIREKFLTDNQYLGVNTPVIQRLAQEISRQGTNMVHTAWLCRNKAYDILDYYNDHEWYSAPEVINIGSGSCSEYSLLISALCRANGIPTRLVGSTRMDEDALVDSGRGYTSYSDTIYHRWVEVYIPGTGWLPIESTADDEDDGNHTDYRFLGYDNWHLVLSKTFYDEDYLGINYHSSYSWSSGGQASSYRGNVEKSRFYEWKVYAE